MQGLYTNFDGRIGRGQWWKGILILVVLVIAIQFILFSIISQASFFGRLLSFVIGLVVIYPYLALGSKRLHDRGKPMMPWIAIFIGPAFVLNVMQVFGIGFQTTELMGETMMVPTTLGSTVGIVAMITSIWALVELGFLKGTAGPNEYGSDPLGQA